MIGKKNNAKATGNQKNYVDIPWDQAIQQVLRETNEAMTSEEISRAILDKGLRQSGGATPAATVASYLSVSISRGNSPYNRVGRGLYTIRDELQEEELSIDEELVELEDVAEAGALNAFGMYWQRDKVIWTGTPRLTGKQGSGASDVNFADQIGIYLLHDRDRVIYVGRAADTLYARLKAHTTDRLSSRWDRFSWFGLYKVSADGNLSIGEFTWSPQVVIETMEALLIESLEPPLNRKRGDNISAVEFIQVVDPQLEKAQKQALLDEMRKGMGL